MYIYVDAYVSASALCASGVTGLANQLPDVAFPDYPESSPIVDSRAPPRSLEIIGLAKRPCEYSLFRSWIFFEINEDHAFVQ